MGNTKVIMKTVWLQVCILFQVCILCMGQSTSDVRYQCDDQCQRKQNEGMMVMMMTQFNQLQNDMQLLKKQQDADKNATESEMVKLNVNMSNELEAERALHHTLQNKVTNLKSQVQALEAKLGKVSAVASASAYMTTGITHPNDGEVIQFGGVHVNNGGQYNSGTGKFTCSLPGVYFFSFNMYSAGISIVGKDKSAVLLMLNGQEISRAICSNDNIDNVSIQCGNSVLIQCRNNQQVWVQATSSNNQFYGTASNKASSFTAFLVHAS